MANGFTHFIYNIHFTNNILLRCSGPPSIRIIISWHDTIISCAVFGLRHRDKTAKVIDYKGQVIRAQGITSFYGAPLLLMVIVGLRGYAIIII